MNALVLYDSVYGNTAEIAQAIAEGIKGQAYVLGIAPAEGQNVSQLDLLVVGSPVHGGLATPKVMEYLNKIPAGSLKGVNVAAFDTRFALEEHGLGLKIVMKVIRFAAPRIARELVKKGGKLIAEPEGFIVDEKEGPLHEGELYRAAAWGKALRLNMNSL